VVSLAALAALVVLAWLAWSRLHPGALPRDPGLSVLLVSIDTLRADALGCYGNAGARTPWIDRLAREGVRFDAAHAHNVVTLPSHVNMLTGLHPFEHGVRDNTGFRVPEGTATLASLLKPRGCRSAGFVSAFVLDERFGLASGFDRWDDRVAGGEPSRGFLIPERPGPRTVAEATRWLASVSRPSFAFVHLYEPHAPYQPPPGFAAAGEHPYHGEVAAADKALEPLLRPILEQGRAARTLVILISDHGEALGEHGEATHGVFAYEPTLRVPLVVYAPGLFRPRVVGEPVRHVDLVPTVLDVLGADVPAQLPGRSLLPLLAGRGAGEPPAGYFEAVSASINRRWAPLYGLLDGGLKYVELPLPELYDLRADPGETRNLAASRPQQLERLSAKLKLMRAPDRGVTPVRESPETLERLRALGYVSSARPPPPKQRYGEDDDPKRLIALDAKANRMLELYHRGRIEEAIALGREVIGERPDMDLAYLQLACLERARGNLRDAIAAAQHAVALRPGDAEPAALLAAYLTEAGRAKGAADLLALWLERGSDDLDVLNAAGMALATAGRRREALDTLERARRAHPRNTEVLVNIGAVLLMSGDLERARQAFEAALDVDPEAARAHNSLGVIAARQGRVPEAIERWKRAAALDPDDYQALFNLGSELWRSGRRDEARPYLESLDMLRVALLFEAFRRLRACCPRKRLLVIMDNLHNIHDHPRFLALLRRPRIRHRHEKLARLSHPLNRVRTIRPVNLEQH
jgi:tetratricopeptide (TPR) repeat protein